MKIALRRSLRRSSGDFLASPWWWRVEGGGMEHTQENSIRFQKRLCPHLKEQTSEELLSLAQQHKCRVSRALEISCAYFSRANECEFELEAICQTQWKDTRTLLSLAYELWPMSAAITEYTATHAVLYPFWRETLPVALGGARRQTSMPEGGYESIRGAGKLN